MKKTQLERVKRDLPSGYAKFLSAIKARIQQAQMRAVLAVNSEVINLYWSIGRNILIKQNEQGWGPRYMRAFAEAWPDHEIVQRVVAQIPWGHNVSLFEKVKEPEKRLWYAQKDIENEWSRPVLVHQIESGLFERQGAAQNNFRRTLPAPQTELAERIIKDPYNFDFLTLGDAAKERELHRGLLFHLREFLLELGVGFVFVGSEYHLQVGESDFYIDLLFYHLQLRSYVAIETRSTSLSM